MAEETARPDASRRENPLLGALQEVTEGECDLSRTFPVTGTGDLPKLGRLLNALFKKLCAATTRYAANTIALSKITPQLERLSDDLAVNAKVQATHASEIASSVTELHQASRHLTEIIDLIERTATQTKILSINASIEASRAGSHGRAFGVVAGEIQRLSDQTMEATSRVASVLGAIQRQIQKTASAAGVTDTSTTTAESQGTSLSKLANAQANQAVTLSQLAHQSRETCDQLVLDVGVFRIAAHKRARQLVEGIVSDPALTGFDRDRQEGFLRNFITNHPAFELLYVTDTRGRQVTRNIGTADFKAAYGTDGLGADWSGRPWFQGAVRGGQTFVSNVYRSAASGQFCFTVSCLIQDSSGNGLGVLGADVRLEDILVGA
ncbi:MAG TPA: methyl-accepting chemotaxis protein [Verrucomicrobiae bacterium]|nr:methyl-accepting chemotaxis protein [Verrucomicrobiae bacterium]